MFHVDAFTVLPFGGNPATVVLDADELDVSRMQAIAREFAHAECAFVRRPSAPDEDIAIRFFNSRKEASFVGHATLAAHAALLAAGRRPLGRARQRCAIGIVEVDARRDALTPDRPPTIEFRRTAPRLEAPLPLKTTLRVAEALGLPGERLHEALPARACRDGGARLLIPLADAGALETLAPRIDVLLALGRELGVDGFFPFAYRRDREAAVTESRMFCPAIGIPEDPVSGNAHAMLVTYLFEASLVRPLDPGFVGLQGRHLGRPGRVEVRWDLEAGRPIAVRIGGHAVIIGEGTLAV